MSLPEPATVYQLRIRLDRISPMVWRRLLVHDTTTIAQLHAIIQLAFGWHNDYLHQFLIYGKAYGISYIGGTSFADEPQTVRLADFRFRTGERFFYEYNFYVPWRHEIRLEQILPAVPGRHYPVYIGGARAAPPDECAGPKIFLALRDEHHVLDVIQRLLDLIDNPEDYLDPDEELRKLKYWLGVDRCNRRALNRRLRKDPEQALEDEVDI
jgi:hypothetical protein